ncbi:hypothetical protein HY522_11130 [bacterium]|nr:hypothetical protein [bacterium]
MKELKGKSEIRNSKSEIQIPPVTYDPALIESAVRRRVDAASDNDSAWIASYRAELDDIYDQPEYGREAAFAALDRRFFQRIGIPTVVDECLAEREASLAAASSVTIIAARSRAEEGVDVTRDGRMVLRCRPESFAPVEEFRANLRRELIQAADCFDPSFGHAPELLDNMMPSEKERIRAALSGMWASSAEGRLQTGEAGGRRTFPEMFDLCRAQLGSQAVAAGICDLCRFPSEDIIQVSELSPGVRAALKAEFPDLRDDSPVCVRCKERTETSQGETR